MDSAKLLRLSAPLLQKKAAIPMVTIPQYMLSSPGSVAEGYESTTGWASYGTGTVANNNTPGQFTQGTQGIKFLPASVAQRSYKTLASSANITNFERIYLDIFQHDAFKHITVRLYDATETNYVDAQVTIDNPTNTAVGKIIRGRLSRRRCTVVGSIPAPCVEVRMNIETSTATTHTLDNLILDAKGFGAGVVLCFDDDWSSHYDMAYRILKAHNIRASEALIHPWINTAGFMTWAQVQELDRAGWSILNHGDSHVNLAGQDLATQTARIQGAIDAMAANGLSRCSHYIAYYAGSYDNVTLTACANLGMLLGRGVGSQDVVNLLPHQDIMQINSNTISDADTVAQAEAYLDNAITDKGVAVYHFHNLGAAGEWTEAQFQQFVDYIVVKCKAGLLYPLTFDDFYKLHSGPVAIPAII
jgi:peptidoglycan/xylan/chitin deacetylase (PgdA/CDA1 family)